MDSPPAATRTMADGTAVPLPRWTGGPPPGRLLVLDEQGLGDTIQFVRFLPRLVGAGVAVTLVTHERLFPLLASLGVPLALRPMGRPGRVAADGWCPLLSLPYALGLGGDALAPPGGAYLAADPAHAETWRRRLDEARPQAGGRIRIGIAWQGNKAAPGDKGRSAPLDALAPLAAHPAVDLVSLQVGGGADQVPACAFGDTILVPEAGFDAGTAAFADSAAAMMALDLVVSVDTAVAHLAGALGRPVWIALRRNGADWRWPHGRSDCVWYPSARLYRQERDGDWWGVFARMAADLAGGAPMVPVAVGELLDKITILEIKRARIPAGPKRANVVAELAGLAAARARLGLDEAALGSLVEELAAVNAALWTIEDDIRMCEARGEFGDRFVALARSVYAQNDRRAAIKSRLNAISGSALREEKSYAAAPAVSPMPARCG